MLLLLENDKFIGKDEVFQCCCVIDRKPTAVRAGWYEQWRIQYSLFSHFPRIFDETLLKLKTIISY